jgi:hypothetical protein
MRDEVGFIQRQARAQKAQALKTAKLLQGRLTDALNRNCKRRLVPEQAEKDHVVFADKRFDLRSFELYGVRGITADQAKIAPDGDESCPLAYNCFVKPIGILAAVTAAIDECACKNIVIFQNSRPVPSPNTRRHRRRYPTTMPYPQIPVLLLREQVANFGQQYFFS